MSARSARKSLELTLAPELRLALGRFRAARGDRSAAAAARRALRESLGLARAAPGPATPPRPALRARRRARPRLRLQLEPELRAALAAADGACAPEAMLRRLGAHLAPFRARPNAADDEIPGVDRDACS